MRGLTNVSGDDNPSGQEYMGVPDALDAMRTRREFLGAAVATTVVSGCVDRSVSQASSPGLFVPSLEQGTIQPDNTCDGGDHSPEIQITNVSRKTNALALVVDALANAASEPIAHWIVWNLPPETATVPSGVPQRPTVSASLLTPDPGLERRAADHPFVQGTNYRDTIGYAGPCPTDRPLATTYRFRLYELDSRLALASAARRGAVVNAIDDHQRSSAEISATYDRQTGQTVDFSGSTE